ncbi:T9SS type A sorting domain-containing protein [Fluviicola chungangensis]|uniref:T9SS type A sorting domain-containing protein n=1 Tax=Fluviicola chungangensis TaxID=2597671 RepID=A0A556MGK3_9FLAO|nr:T9SS type A sorting domain-containing protein [Fluviicola chungangensis]TSJ39071.1 T9SS type A sorting domain-containing protein [Fluviicola chungangensis]
MKFILTSLACICGYLSHAQCSVTSSTSSTNSACGAATGSATVTPSSGTAPYTYLWSNGSNTQTIMNVAVGIYTVAITDANGCTGSNTVTVDNPNAPTASISSVMHVYCFGNASGQTSVAASGGTAPYTYIWSNGMTTSGITGLVAGSYSVTVTDAAACADQVQVTITQPSQLSATSSSTPASCYGESDGAIETQVMGGTAPYFYFWSNAETTQDISDLAPGTYTLNITDVNNCNLQITATVTEPDLIRDTISNSACGSYFWEGQNYTVSDYYEHTYTTANGCDSIVTLNLTINSLPDNAITSSGATFTAAASGATYQWINCSDNSEIQGAQSQSFTATQNGSYAVIVSNGTCSDTSNCITLSDLGLTDNNPDLISIAPNPTKGQVSISVTENMHVRLTNLVGESIHTYYLETGVNSIDISELPAGTYLLVGSRSSHRIVKQ